MTVWLKVTLIGLIALLVTLIIYEGTLSISKLDSINQNITNEAIIRVPSIYAVSAIKASISDLRSEESVHILSKNEEDMAAAEGGFNVVMAELKEYQAKYEPLISSDDKREIYEKFNSKLSEYLVLHQQLFALSRVNRNEDAAALYKGQMHDVYAELSGYISQSIQMNLKSADSDYKVSQSAYRGAQATLFKALQFCTLISVAIGFVAIGLIQHPFRKIIKLYRAISGKNRVYMPHFASRSEISEVETQITAPKSEPALDETVKAQPPPEPEIISVPPADTVGQELLPASIARATKVLASSANDGVKGPSKSATGIGAVVSRIEKMATQTNLMALNSTIEAVRASKAGKDFAIAAAEVNELAQHTAKTTSDIVGHITGIRGVMNAANDTAESVEEVAEAIKVTQARSLSSLRQLKKKWHLPRKSGAPKRVVRMRQVARRSA